MEMNPYYITPQTILNRLARVHKGKQIQEADVIEWAAECTTEYIEDFDSFVKYEQVLLTKETNNRFYLPCLVYRVLDVYNSSDTRIPFVKRQGYITAQDITIETIYIDYVGIPTTDNGELLIDKNHAQAVEAFIVHKLYYEDFLNNKVHPNVWQDIKLTLENELIAARGSYRHWDQSKFETISAIRGNMVPELGKVPLFKMYNTAGK